MRKKKILHCIAPLLCVLTLSFLAVCDIIVPGNAVLFCDMSAQEIAVPDFITLVSDEKSVPAIAAQTGNKNEGSVRLTAKLFGVIPLKSVEVSYIERQKVYPGGMAFGVRLYMRGVMIVGMSPVETSAGELNPAYDSGLRSGDIIIKIDGNEVNASADVSAAIARGETLTFDIERAGEPMTFKMTPVPSVDGLYKAGLWIRDSTAGIGTVTFITENGDFMGLGHGICDVDTGELIPMRDGEVSDVTISGINPGRAGVPGELKGYFGQQKIGVLTKNTACGVMGSLYQKPANIPEGALDMGLRDDVREGDAYIYCMLDDNTVSKYSIKILKIDRYSTDNKSFLIEITDPALLARTGGIVQGMSGSPIIQDGKLIGAVTHVLVNDPARGYGIFIENMTAQ